MFDYRHVLKYIKKQFRLRDLGIIAAIVSLYFTLRLAFLDGFPIFSDEAIYIQWAKVAANDANWRFISLTDGKQPLQTWLTIPFLKLVPDNALLAGRLVAVFTGFIALTGVFAILQYLFNKRTAYFGALLYCITPYFLFYDRLALIDSGVAAASVWILFFSILLVRTNRLDVALLFGMIAGVALLAKSSVKLFLGLSALAPVLTYGKNWRVWFDRSANYFILLTFVSFIGFLIYNVQRLSPFFGFIAQKNTTFVLTPSELIANPFQVFFRNAYLIPYYVFSEMGYVLGLLGVAGLYRLYKNDRKLAGYFALWLIVPYIALAFAMEVLYPRYILFFPMVLILLAAYWLQSLKSRQLLAGSVVAILASVGYFNYTIIADYENIPLPQVDRGQYIEDWPSGWGAREIVEFARKQSNRQPVILLAEGNFGMAGDVLSALLRPSDRITVDGKWPLNREDVIAAQQKTKDNLVYVVFSHRTEFPPDWPMKLVKEYVKPGGNASLFLYQVKRPEGGIKDTLPSEDTSPSAERE
ncbi:MAG: glycosyltransferase family 39 protein [Patescibacteria group bacterium]|nr:glycosyltransferase family 39 protein [Patescibacteria group bacterium]